MNFTVVMCCEEFFPLHQPQNKKPTNLQASVVLSITFMSYSILLFLKVSGSEEKVMLKPLASIV